VCAGTVTVIKKYGEFAWRGRECERVEWWNCDIWPNLRIRLGRISLVVETKPNQNPICYPH